jgi:hypothetical protein
MPSYSFEDEKPAKSYSFVDDAPAAPITRTDKFARGLRDPIDGGAQLLTNMLPKGLVDAGNKANNWLADKTGLVGRLPEGGVNQQVRESEAKYQAQRAAGGESGFDGYRTLGNVASPANLAIAARAPAAATLAGRIGSGALAGAASSALAPVAGGDFWDEKAQQVALGGAVGGAVPAVAGGMSRLISPNASRNPQLALLKSEGVRPTIGQTLGGWANRAEEKAQSIPIMGDMISKARRSANSQFEASAHNRALAPIGQALPEGVAGRDAVNYTEGALKSAYDGVLGRIGAISPDETFSTNVVSLQKMVNGLLMPKAEKAKFAAALSDVKQSIDQNGVLTSDAYKALESSLGADARKLGASTNIYEGKLAPAVKQLQAELRDMLKRQAGPEAKELAAVNTGWANFKRAQNAAGKLGADDGAFSPAQFQNAVRTMDKSKDKGAFARGSALGQDLSDAGKSVLGLKVPNSGSADRLLFGGGALGSYLINPAIPASLLGGAAMYTHPAQRLLGAAVSSRPDFAQPTADALRRASPMLVPGAAQLGLGLLDQ